MKPIDTDMNSDLIITLDDDTWQVVGQGVNVNGEVFCHLVSTTRYRQQKNGKNPIQSARWVPEEMLK